MKDLFRYEDFLLEAVIKKTMPLYYSEEFRNILSKMSDKSRYANFLLQAEDSNQVSDIYTLIDTTDKNDTVSFIQVNRIIRGLPDSPDSYQKVEKEEDKEVYHLKRNVTNKPENEFWTKGRTEIGFGRWVRRVTTELHKSSIPDNELEKFVNLYKSSYDFIKNPESMLQLVEGEDIRKWYLESNYSDGRGQLNNSCMRYPKCQDYLDIYVKNPESCKLLILKDENDDSKIKGRALVWKIYKHPRGKYEKDYYMDRIYTVKDSDKNLFKEWADKNNMDHYPDNRFNSMYVKLESGDFNKYPYMDTFLCYNDQHLLLSNDESLWPKDGYIKIQETNGEFIGDDVVYSEWHGEYIERESAAYCEDIDDYVYLDDAIYLEYKDIYVSSRADTCFSEYHNESFYTDDVVRSEMMNDYLYPENSNVIKVIISSDGDEDWCVKSRTDLYLKVGDEYYSKRRYIKDPYSDEFHFVDEKQEGTVLNWAENLYHKILEEIIPEDKQEEDYWTTLRPIVISQIKDIIINEKFDKEKVVEEISKNEIFRSQIRGVFWGWFKNDVPEPEDMIPLVVAMKIKGTTIKLARANSVTFNNCLIEANDFTKNDDVKRKMRVWQDVRFLKKVGLLSESINNETFGIDFYKRILFISI